MLTSSGGGAKAVDLPRPANPAFMGLDWEEVRAGSFWAGRVLAGQGGMFSRLSWKKKRTLIVFSKLKP